jgi:hypothetical protein
VPTPDVTPQIVELPGLHTILCPVRASDLEEAASANTYFSKVHIVSWSRHAQLSQFHDGPTSPFAALELKNHGPSEVARCPCEIQHSGPRCRICDVTGYAVGRRRF